MSESKQMVNIYYVFYGLFVYIRINVRNKWISSLGTVRLKKIHLFLRFFLSFSDLK